MWCLLGLSLCAVFYSQSLSKTEWRFLQKRQAVSDFTSQRFCVHVISAYLSLQVLELSRPWSLPPGHMHALLMWLHLEDVM